MEKTKYRKRRNRFFQGEDAFILKEKENRDNRDRDDNVCDKHIDGA